MKIKILNKRLRANGGRWQVGDIVEVSETWPQEAEAVKDMFEIVPEPKKFEPKTPKKAGKK